MLRAEAFAGIRSSGEESMVETSRNSVVIGGANKLTLQVGFASAERLLPVPRLGYENTSAVPASQFRFQHVIVASRGSGPCFFGVECPLGVGPNILGIRSGM